MGLNLWYDFLNYGKHIIGILRKKCDFISPMIIKNKNRNALKIFFIVIGNKKNKWLYHTI